jgi:transcriptional regulator with XRE-family HTH domain
MPRKLKYELEPLPIELRLIGKRIASLRRALGLTQSQLAGQLKITQTLISDYETGRARLNDEMIVRFAVALKTSADTLLGLSEKGTSTPFDLKTSRRLEKLKGLSSEDRILILRMIDKLAKQETSKN